MKARVIVRRKSGVLDPHGEALRQTLGTLGFEGVSSVRIGKVVEMEVASEGVAPEVLRTRIEAMANQLLANPVIETFRVELDEETQG